MKFQPSQRMTLAQVKNHEFVKDLEAEFKANPRPNFIKGLQPDIKKKIEEQIALAS
jgi:hypothetical protein